jgi:Regulator of ribonuclease activity B
MSPTPDWAETVLARQLAMNAQTWHLLQEQGVDAASKLALEFFYSPSGQDEAERLAAFLRADTDYDVDVVSQTRGMFGKGFSVMGKTQPTAVSVEILNDWVTWMVTAGVEKGPCEFDGWGAQAG